MSTHLHLDDRGILVPCPACGTTNRMAYARLDKESRCGTCKNPLPPVGAPVTVSSQDQFALLAENSPLPVLVDFWAPWCGPCRMMAPEFEKAAALASGQMILAKINSDELPAVSNHFRIQGIPAFVLLRNGQEAGRTAGFQAAQQLLAWARSASGS